MGLEFEERNNHTQHYFHSQAHAHAHTHTHTQDVLLQVLLHPTPLAFPL
jgi:hypothetical protein